MSRKTHDLTGLKFNKLTVISFVGYLSDGKQKNGSIARWAFWNCLCDCGNQTQVRAHHLKSGHVKSCGCLNNPENLTGQKFGRLTALELTKKRGSNGGAVWRCECECGKISFVRSDSLKDGAVKSCGCARDEKRKEKHSVNGITAALAVFDRFKSRAKKRGYSFKLLFDEAIILFEQSCFYCGAEPAQISHSYKYNGDFIYNGIDRKNNELGYILDNCVSCCGRCNRAKSFYTEDSFREWIGNVYNNYVKEKVT